MDPSQPERKGKHRWLAWVGLQEPPPDPEALVPVATGAVSDPDTGCSDYASKSVEKLKAAGIEAHQRPYVVDSGLGAALMLGNRPVDARIRVAVLVHAKDAENARSALGTEPDHELGGAPIGEAQAALWLGRSR